MYGTLYSGDPNKVLDGPLISGGLASGTNAQMAAGTIVAAANGRLYKYVKLGTEASVAAVKGAAVYWTDLACTTITTDQSDGIAPGLGGGCAGVWIRPTTTAALQGFDSAHYAFIQCGGVAPCQSDGSVTAGDMIWANATDGIFMTAVSANTGVHYFLCGTALETDGTSATAGGELNAAHGGSDSIASFYCKLSGLI